MPTYPDWVILHIPHDSKVIPSDIREQFLLNDTSLEAELLLMTDAGTKDLFLYQTNHKNVAYHPVSRLVVDVERFPDDAQEPMAKRGMGVIYTHTASQKPLRRALSPEERQDLLDRYYYPHHEALTKQVTESLEKHGQCLVLDCHSFPSKPLPYESNQDSMRPDICIGTNPFHTPPDLEQSFVRTFSESGYTVAINKPFSGALVPLRYYMQDTRVSAIMVEVNRSLYMDEETGFLLEDFLETAERITGLCQRAIEAYWDAK